MSGWSKLVGLHTLSEPWELFSLSFPDYSLYSLKDFPTYAQLCVQTRDSTGSLSTVVELFLWTASSFLLSCPTNSNCFVSPQPWLLKLCWDSFWENGFRQKARAMIGLTTFVSFSPGWQSCAAWCPMAENSCFIPIFPNVLILQQEDTSGPICHSIMAGSRGLKLCTS